MSNRKTIRAWKDEEFRLGLNDAERSLLQENPVGAVELTDSDLRAAVGGIVRPVTNGIAVCTSAVITKCCY